MNDKYMDLIDPENKKAYTKYKEGTLDFFPYQSHQPVLIHMLNTITTGSVLEIGIGSSSTPILRLICEKQKRDLVSIETDVNWVNQFPGAKHLERENIIKDPLLKRKYAIAFIDGPDAEDRQPQLEKVKADYIIVHDTDGAVNKVKDAFSWDFSKFKHVYHFTSATPMTSVLSNLDKINKDILTIFK